MLEAVKRTEVADDRHPVHAALVDVEAIADSGEPTPGGRRKRLSKCFRPWNRRATKLVG